jgi:ATP-binding cassette subfamily B protein
MRASEDVVALAWPLDRLGEAMQRLAAEAGLGPKVADLEPPNFASPSEEPIVLAPWLASTSERHRTEIKRYLGRRIEDERLGIWIEAAADFLAVEAQPLRGNCHEIEQLIAEGGPMLVRVGAEGGPRFLAVGRAHGRRVEVLAPDLTRGRVKAALVARAVRRRLEAPITGEIDAILADLQLPPARAARAREHLIGERVGSRIISGLWRLRPSPSAGFAHQARGAGLDRRFLAFLLVYAVQYTLFLLSWWILGRAALDGRTDSGWLSGWALLLITIAPLGALTTWTRGLLATGIGFLLKVRLLHGALSLEVDAVRSEGTGHLLARVLESQAVETLALTGGFLSVIALLELAMAAGVLALGAGGWPHALMLASWLLFFGALARRYLARRRRWTEERLGLTHDLVERMVGHRTVLAQELPERRHAGEDEAVERYLARSRDLDGTAAVIEALLPRGWLIVGVLGLVPALVAGHRSPGSIAAGLGGVLLAYQSFRKLGNGLWNLVGAAVAWREVAPIYRAAGTASPQGDPGVVLAKEEKSGASTVLDVHDVTFRYGNRGEAVLKGVSLAVSPADRLLLEGSSGGGKSTLASLITGLRQPDSGLVLIGGLDWQTLGRQGWRKRIAAAPQFHENHVLTGTFAFNLLMGRRWPPLPQDGQEAIALCEELGLGDLLKRMPGGLEQMVGETGWQLSHGERSRLFLARALLQDADLIVLDESFAALDPENLDRAIRCVLARPRAILVIAHP